MPVSSISSREEYGYTDYAPETDGVCGEPPVRTEDEATEAGAVDTLDVARDEAPHDVAPITWRAAARHNETEISADLAGLRGRDPKNGLELQVLDVSAKVSETRAEAGGCAQAVMAHLGVSREDGRAALRGELFTAGARASVTDVSGTVDIGVGASATLASAEVTAPLGSNIAGTFGVSAGVGGAARLTVSSPDQQGKQEVCGRLEATWLIVGACIKLPH